MFIENKYTRVYYAIIEKNKNTKKQKFFDQHHIIPRCMGGLDISENLVFLSFREHSICHWLLTKMVSNLEDKLKLVSAHWLMKNRENYYYSRKYELARKTFITARTGNFKHTEKTKKEMSERRRGVSTGPKSEFTKKKLSDHFKKFPSITSETMTKEHKINISKALKGRSFSESHCKNLSISKIGISMSEDSKLHLSRKMKGRPPSYVITEDIKRKMSEKAKLRPKRIWVSKIDGFPRLIDMLDLESLMEQGWHKGRKFYQM